MFSPRWDLVWGNCNAPYHVGDGAYVRCTAIENHRGLHRCHLQPHDRIAVLMWGDDDAAVSLDALAATPNPLALAAPSDPATDTGGEGRG